MNNIICSMEKLKENAILITNDTGFYNPSSKEVFTLSPDVFSLAYQKHYEAKNGIVSFIDETNKWYVIPAIKGVLETLKIAGFIKGGFFVPCAEDCCQQNRSYPIKDKGRWDAMLAIV